MTEHKKDMGKRFDEEFKREAARLASQAGKTDEQVARDLGVSAWSVSRWRREFGLSEGAGGRRPQPGPGRGSSRDGQRGRAGASDPGVAARERRSARAENDLKKSRRHLLGRPALKMTAIAQLAGQHSVRMICRALGVARSAYYATAQKSARPRAREDVRLGVKIAVLFEQSHRTYGSPRLVMALRRAGERCGRRRVARLMPLKYAGCPRPGPARPAKTPLPAPHHRQSPPLPHRPQPLGGQNGAPAPPRRGLGGRHHLRADRRRLVVCGWRP